MATRKPVADQVSAAAAPAEQPQPTHGGVYELVDGQLRAVEGGPPKVEQSTETTQPAGEGA